MDHAHHGIDHSGHMGHMDHMNHSGHDHMAMDHMMMGDSSSHGMVQDTPAVEHMHHHAGMDMGGGGHMMMMSMTFHFGTNEKILFDSWHISSVEGLLLSMLGIFVLALVYEGLKYFREYWFWKTYNALRYRSVEMAVDKNLPDCNHVVQPSILSLNHLLQTILHIVQVTLSYLLMLIFMTYNVWLCIAVVLGAAAGYFLFGWKKSVVVDVTEHCH